VARQWLDELSETEVNNNKLGITCDQRGCLLHSCLACQPQTDAELVDDTREHHNNKTETKPKPSDSTHEVPLPSRRSDVNAPIYACRRTCTLLPR